MSSGKSLGIMQPYFFPYLGHFSLIAAVDEWVVFDLTQYTPKTWMNRNRVLHPGGGCQYVSVPLSNSSIHIKTSQANVLSVVDTEQSVLGKLTHYKRQAPFYDAVIGLVREVFANTPSDSLVHLNATALAKTCAYLGIPFRYSIASEMNLNLPPTLGAGEWALYITSALGASTYINPLSGAALFSAAAFEQRGIDLKFLEPRLFEYSTGRYGFEPYLSVLDVMMWNSPQTVADAVRSHCIIRTASELKTV